MTTYNKSRENWIDHVKALACFLVLTGHLMQSLAKADIIPANELYTFFDRTIYYFHVPLFFICSGYLFEKYGKVSDVESWKRFIVRRVVKLGLPYLVFSILTWILKSGFKDSVNSQVDSLPVVLFLRPISPYWFLYTLIVLSVLSGRAGKCRRSVAIWLSLAVALKVIRIAGYESSIFIVNSVMDNSVWYVFGWCWVCWTQRTDEMRKIWRLLAYLVGFVGAVIASVLALQVQAKSVAGRSIAFALGIVFCVVILSMVRNYLSDTACFWANYTMPIFLMHTLFAAPVRVMLLKIGIQNSIIHILLGLAVSIGGPMAAGTVLSARSGRGHVR